MTRSTIFILLVFALLSCNSKKEAKKGTLNIVLYESYNLTELAPLLLDANRQIRKLQLDSIANSKTGLTLLDNINEEQAKSVTNGNMPEDNPLFQVFSPNTVRGYDNSNYLDTSAIIGMIFDSVTLKKYLVQVKPIFPQDLVWRITGKLANNGKCLHALKQGKTPIKIYESDIDSVIVTPLGLVNITKYWIQIKLRRELDEKLSTRTYTLLINTDSYEYSGSVSNFLKNWDQYILIGEMDKIDFQALQTVFTDRIMIKNNI